MEGGGGGEGGKAWMEGVFEGAGGNSVTMGSEKRKKKRRREIKKTEADKGWGSVRETLVHCSCPHLWAYIWLQSVCFYISK